MSVVVRMDMPENCFECPFSIFDETVVWCNVITNNVYGYVERDEGCPIICSLPEGHGRLVDADAYDYPGDLKWEPTIVPAEAERS